MANMRKGLRPRSNRDPRLPKPFLGCWTDKAWRRKYWMIHMRILREGLYRDKERERELERGPRKKKRKYTYTKAERGKSGRHWSGFRILGVWIKSFKPSGITERC